MTLDDYCRKFSAYLERKRMESGLTVSELAVLSGFTVGHIARVLNGTHSPSYKARRAMSMALGLGIDGLENEAIGIEVE
jgi:transcriptional regulator with XRE-family HTH domain